jgi:predicted CopG family antitoxin
VEKLSIEKDRESQKMRMTNEKKEMDAFSEIIYELTDLKIELYEKIAGENKTEKRNRLIVDLLKVIKAIDVLQS